MKVGVGFSENPDSAIAGKQAAQGALENAGIEETCDVVLLFCTARHNQKILYDSVAAAVGRASRIYGGGAVGVITNEEFGYAGDQVGVACLWLEKSECDVFIDQGLLEGEEAAGARLGKQLAEKGVTPDSPVVLFYDAIDLTQGEVKLLMATWLLRGIEEELGFLPDLTGAGLQGDHVCSPAAQFIGEGIDAHSAMALSFSDDIHIDSAIMHGCLPASTYYTVTKAEGPVILEINGEPAIPFIDQVLGSSILPEEYPFFLLFGLNYGDRWGDYDENHYASRLCLGLDIERNGIVMFEPDMVEGTEFQIMYRSLEYAYMKPKIEALFNSLDGRKPVFGMYIDCAGRCAGYGGLELEDAVVVQEAVAGRVPLLGLYTGVEIASIEGRPRGLDWTGVFCLFSEETAESQVFKEQALKEEKRTEAPSDSCSHQESKEMPLDVALKLAERNVAKVLALDVESISIRHELEQKRRGFSLLSELSVALRQEIDYENVLSLTSKRINAALNMQKTVVLSSLGDGSFAPSTMQGYAPEERACLQEKSFKLDEVFLNPEKPVLVTSAHDEGYLAEIRTALELSYFISAPIVVKDEVIAVLITGRMVEAVPFLSRLGHTDVETIQAACALLSTLLVYQRWDAAAKKARTDVLTGLYNRDAFEHEVTKLLQEASGNHQQYAFLMVDCDLFKQVNDTYGHLQGDEVLRALADTLRTSFRSGDIIARLGGDEFALFCPAPEGLRQMVHAIDRLLENWRSLAFTTGDKKHFNTTLSIGVSVFPSDATSYTELFQKADIALYQSKQNGRDRYTIYQAGNSKK